jgi:hypothetical protein
MSMKDPTDIRSQDRAREQAALRNKLAADTEESDIKWLMGSKRGRRIIYRFLDQAGTFRLSFNTNAMQMAFAEGNRNMGNRLLAVINTQCPELYPVMVKEAANDRRNPDDE